MGTMFTEFRFFNKSPKPASAVVASGPMPNPTTASTEIKDVPSNDDDTINPGKNVHRYARVTVFPDGKGSVEATYECGPGESLNVLHVTLETAYTLTLTDKDCGTPDAVPGKR